MMEILDCRDHSCWFAIDKSGQRTNGGCRCLKDLPPEQRRQIIFTLQKKVSEERERCAKIVDDNGYKTTAEQIRGQK